ncbi:hypothetical protein B0H13DRAFT_2353690 [Mycena leptocephala]|nr:hypothetical protein B0H13DRAFT_2353690 [Mycena leptocephala]
MPFGCNEELDHGFGQAQSAAERIAAKSPALRRTTIKATRQSWTSLPSSLPHPSVYTCWKDNSWSC